MGEKRKPINYLIAPLTLSLTQSSDMHQEFVVLVCTVPPVKYRFVLTVNQTTEALSTLKKNELVYASISLCLNIIKIHMLCIVLALVIVGHSDHNLF